MSTRRSRVSIAQVPLVLQPDLDELHRVEPPVLGEFVTEIAPRPEDRLGGRRRFEVVVAGWRLEVTVEAVARAELRERARRGAAAQQVAAEMTLRAKIPGRIARVWVADGEHVEQGQRLLAIEAMKMENEIRAPQTGVVRAIRVEVGSRVEREDELLTVA